MKTLKDRETQWMNSNIDQSKKDILLQFNHELKAEAIKWVKELRKQWLNHAVAKINGIEWPYSKVLEDWIKHQYNITEEDLK